MVRRGDRADAMPIYRAPWSGHTDPGIPRRLDVRDAGFDPTLGSAITVTMEGVVVGAVVAYDADRGQLVQYEKGADGKIVTSKASGRRVPMLETVRGDLAVRWTEGVPSALKRWAAVHLAAQKDEREGGGIKV